MKNKNYAYLDKYGILHIVDAKKSATEYADGVVVETTVKDNGGFPVVNGHKYFYYAKENELYKDHNKGVGNEIDIKEAPADLIALIEQLTK